MAKTHIEWTESTWNPVTGCNKISPGCKNCYAERMAKRLKAMNSPNYRNGFELSLHKHVLDYPLLRKKPQTIFVNSMSDLFHENIPSQFIYDIFKVMNKASWHNFQILTKRSEYLLTIAPNLNWTTNIWMGVSIENQDYTYRIDYLSKTSAKIKFLSCEPLLGPLTNLDLTSIDWVIVGGESGPRARQMSPDWVREIKNQCVEQNVPFFFKQWGGINKKKTGRSLDGQIWDQMPLKKVGYTAL